MPLALRNLKRRGDLERAGLLIESLAKHWRDSKPLQVLIVSPERDAELLRGSLPRFRNIEVSVRAEGDFFPAFSRFYMMTGWYRQQMIKLHVPAKLGFAGYLTLDSDVCCVGDFDATTFVQDGRALSRWEPKRYHDWWESAAEIVTMVETEGRAVARLALLAGGLDVGEARSLATRIEAPPHGDSSVDDLPRAFDGAFDAGLPATAMRVLASVMAAGIPQAERARVQAMAAPLLGG